MGLDFTASEIVVLIGVLASALISIVGWRKTYTYQKKLLDAQVAQESRKYQRDRLTDQLTVFDEIMTLQVQVTQDYELLLRKGNITSIDSEDYVTFKERRLRFDSLMAKAVDLANLLDKSGEIPQLVRDLMLRTIVITRNAKELLSEELDPELEDKLRSAASLESYEIRQKLRRWMEELQANASEAA